MSINNIKLPDLLVAELYKDALLASPGTSRPAATTPPSPAPAVPAEATTRPTPPAPAPPPHTPPAATVQPNPPQPITPEPSAIYKFLGSNRRKTTIIVNTPGSPFLPDNQLAFLTKILEACQMNIGDVAIVNQASTSIDITLLRRQLSPTVVLLFGLEPLEIRLPVNFPLFKIQPYDQCTYLSAPAVDQLVQNSSESKLLKSKLWVCLKTLFNV